MTCESGWPYSLRDVCPKRWSQLFRTLASGRMTPVPLDVRRPPEVECNQAKAEARTVSKLIKATRRSLRRSEKPRIKRRLRRALRRHRNALKRARATVRRNC